MIYALRWRLFYWLLGKAITVLPKDKYAEPILKALSVGIETSRALTEGMTMERIAERERALATVGKEESEA